MRGQRFDKFVRSLDHRFALRSGAAAQVEQQRQMNRRIGWLEVRDLLLGFVFVNTKSSSLRSARGCPALFKALTLRLTRRVSMRIAFESLRLDRVARRCLSRIRRCSVFPPSSFVASFNAGRAVGAYCRSVVAVVSVTVKTHLGRRLTTSEEARRAGGFDGFIAPAMVLPFARATTCRARCP
jgi:hypothetical protein